MRLIKALNRQPVDKTPVWLMRQAGRYLPEYRKLRAEAGDFLTLCQTPELACEVTLQPLKRFDLDAAIIFSDILTVPHAMGLGLFFKPNHGPCFEKPICNLADIKALPTLDPMDELKYVMDAIELTRKNLASNIPLIGFAGSPWTVATYMIEGGPSKSFSLSKGLLYKDPKALHLLLEHLAKTTAAYLNAQIASGADVLMIFDTWGGVLEKQAYLEFSLHYMKNIVKQIKHPHNKHIPIILFTKNGGKHLIELAESGCQGVGLDWAADLAQAKSLIGDKVALQGNLDPCLLYATPERIQEQVKKILSVYDGAPGHVFNLGHGILPDVPVEHVQALIEAVHENERSVEYA